MFTSLGFKSWHPRQDQRFRAQKSTLIATNALYHPWTYKLKKVEHDMKMETITEWIDLGLDMQYGITTRRYTLPDGTWANPPHI